MVRSCSHGSELVQGIVLKVRPFCIMVEAVLFYKKKISGYENQDRKWPHKIHKVKILILKIRKIFCS